MTELSRRKFIQLTVLSGAVAAAGCDPEAESRYNTRIYRAEATGQYGGYDNRALPYINQPDGYQDGVPQYFATDCLMCPAGCGLFVRTLGGRAVQVQGNPDHPVSLGKVCARGVASLQQVYHPDRLRFPALRRGGTGPVSARADWETALTRTADALRGARGKIAILTDAMTIGQQPTLSRLVTQFAQNVGASVTSYSLLDDAPWRAAAQAVYGRNQLPAYQLDEADYILGFGADFLEAWPSPVYYNRLFGAFRQGPRRKQGEHGKFVYLGPRMNLTAAKADIWLPCNPGTEGLIAYNIATALNRTQVSIADTLTASGLTAEQLYAVIDEFGNAGKRAVAIGGSSILSQPNATATMTAIENLNAQAKSVCVGFGSSPLAVAPAGASGFRQMQTLVRAMQSGQVTALVIVGQPNPAFTLPRAAGWEDALAHVPFIASLAPFEDETTAHAHALLPTRAFLEDWGDSVPAVVPPGASVTTLRQPVIDPQFVTDAPGLSPADFRHDVTPWMDTRPTSDILIDLSHRLGKPLPCADGRDAVRRTWAGLGQADLAASGTDNDAKWVAALGKGGLWTQAALTPQLPLPLTQARGSHLQVGVQPSPVLTGEGRPFAGGVSASSPGTFALHLYPHIYWTDGRHAHLPWLQEQADPMTSAVWNTWVEINPQTAERMGIHTGDIVRLTTPHGSVDAPALPYPAIHPDVVAMPIGQGHTAYGRYANGRGANPLAILDPVADAQTGALAYSATQVTLTRVSAAVPGYNGPQTLVLTQDRPGGAEPEAVQELIHTTAKEWKQAQPVTGSPQAAGSIFHRGGMKPGGQ